MFQAMEFWVNREKGLGSRVLGFRVYTGRNYVPKPLEMSKIIAVSP